MSAFQKYNSQKNWETFNDSKHLGVDPAISNDLQAETNTEFLHRLNELVRVTREKLNEEGN